MNVRPHTKPLKRHTKIYRVLAALMERSYNRFEAAKILHDHTLHSTVSRIQERGVRVQRKVETVPGYMNSKVRVCRYWIDPADLAKAAKLLGMD